MCFLSTELKNNDTVDHARVVAQSDEILLQQTIEQPPKTLYMEKADDTFHTTNSSFIPETNHQDTQHYQEQMGCQVPKGYTDMSNNNRQPPIKISRMDQNGTEDDYSRSLNHRNYQQYPPRRRKPTQEVQVLGETERRSGRARQHNRPQLEIESMDTSAFVDFEGSKVLLVTQGENGNYVQIRPNQTQGAPKVIFTSTDNMQSSSKLPNRPSSTSSSRCHSLLPPVPGSSLSSPNSSITPGRSPSTPMYSNEYVETMMPSTSEVFKCENDEREDIPIHEQATIMEISNDMSAEQKRRTNMKMGFERLEQLVGNDAAAGSKMSKAAVLTKAKEHIERAKVESKRLRQEIALLKRETEGLQNQINVAQDQLPERGTPPSKPRVDKIQKAFREWIHDETKRNPKFYVFSRIMKKLFESYASAVSTNDPNELMNSTHQWVQNYCSMSNIRQISADSLRNLTKETCIVDDRLINQFPSACIKLSENEANQ